MARRMYIQHKPTSKKNPYRFKTGKFGRAYRINSLGASENKRAKAATGKWIPL